MMIRDYDCGAPGYPMDEHISEDCYRNHHSRFLFHSKFYARWHLSRGAGNGAFGYFESLNPLDGYSPRFLDFLYTILGKLSLSKFPASFVPEALIITVPLQRKTKNLHRKKRPPPHIFFRTITISLKRRKEPVACSLSSITGQQGGFWISKSALSETQVTTPLLTSCRELG